MAGGELRSDLDELRMDRRGLYQELKETELSHEDYLLALKKEQDRNITSLRFSPLF